MGNVANNREIIHVTAETENCFGMDVKIRVRKYLRQLWNHKVTVLLKTTTFQNKVMVIQLAISTSQENSRILAANSAQLEEMKIAMQKTHEVASDTKTK